MRKILVLFAVAAMLLSSVPAGAQSLEEARSNLNSARELYSSGAWETAREAYTQAYELAPPASPIKVEATLELGSLHWEQGHYARASELTREALKNARAIGLDHAIGRLMLTLGHIEASLGKFADAEATLKVCSQMAEKQRDANFAALCRVNLRLVHQIRGKNPGPEARYRADLKLLQDSGEDRLVGLSLAKVAELYARTGQFSEAETFLKRAQGHYEKAGSVPATARNRMKLAQLYQDQGRWSDAKREMDGLILKFRNMRSNPSLATAYVIAGRQAAHEGDGPAAARYFNLASASAKKAGSPPLIGNAHLARCEHLARHGKREAAGDACASARSIFESIGAPELVARSRIVLARSAHLAGEYAEAREHYVSIIASLEKQAVGKDAKRSLVTQRVNLCQVELQLEASGTFARCRKAVEELNALGVQDNEIQRMFALSHYAAGVAAYRTRKADEAREHLSKAAKLYETLEDAIRGSEAYLRLGRLESRLKRDSQARKALERGYTWIEQANPEVPEVQKLRIEIPVQLIQVDMRDQDWDKTRERAKELVARAKTYSDHGQLAWAFSTLARAELKLGNRDAAIAALKSGVRAAKKAGDTDMVESLNSNLSKFGE